MNAAKKIQLSISRFFDFDDISFKLSRNTSYKEDPTKLTTL